MFSSSVCLQMSSKLPFLNSFSNCRHEYDISEVTKTVVHQYVFSNDLPNDLVKSLSQLLHWYGFSPVCILKCHAIYFSLKIIFTLVASIRKFPIKKNIKAYFLKCRLVQNNIAGKEIVQIKLFCSYDHPHTHLYYFTNMYSHMYIKCTSFRESFATKSAFS